VPNVERPVNRTAENKLINHDLPLFSPVLGWKSWKGKTQGFIANVVSADSGIIQFSSRRANVSILLGGHHFHSRKWDL
jgi:hypothetical protein